MREASTKASAQGAGRSAALTSRPRASPPHCQALAQWATSTASGASVSSSAPATCTPFSQVPRPVARIACTHSQHALGGCTSGSGFSLACTGPVPARHPWGHGPRRSQLDPYRTSQPCSQQGRGTKSSTRASIASTCRTARRSGSSSSSTRRITPSVRAAPLELYPLARWCCVAACARWLHVRQAGGRGWRRASTACSDPAVRGRHRCNAQQGAEANAPPLQGQRLFAPPRPQVGRVLGDFARHGAPHCPRPRGARLALGVVGDLLNLARGPCSSGTCPCRMVCALRGQAVIGSRAAVTRRLLSRVRACSLPKQVWIHANGVAVPQVASAVAHVYIFSGGLVWKILIAGKQKDRGLVLPWLLVCRQMRAIP
jgi:hypothetical protein